MNLEEFRKACGTFDSIKCAAMLNTIPATEADSRAVILEENVRQTGCFILARLKQGDELKRSQFLEFCRAEIAKSGEPELSVRFEQHVKDAASLERGYRAILDTLKDSPAGQLPPSAQVWAAIGRAVREIAVLRDQMNKTASVQEELFDPVGAKVKREGAPDIDPDFVINTVVNVLGSTIMMLAYENGWLDSKRLVLPGPVTVDEPTLLQAGITAYLGAMWRALKQSDDRLRYFGGELRLQSVNAVDENNIAHKIEALLFQHELGVESVDIIANERLMRVQFGFAMELELETNAAQKISKAESGVPLSPNGYVSFDEMLSFLTLADLFCYPVESDAPIYKGLALKHWLRGYAVIKEKLAHRDGVPILDLRTFSSPELIATFAKFGLSNEQALAFLEATTFSKGRSDLFDTPFLRGQGDSWHLFSPAYMAANISNILVSMLSTNGVQFETKGKRFEAKINALLNKHGLNSKTFKYTVGGDQFECDAVFIWDDRLFVLECKNYGLSGLNVVSSYHFLQKMQEASDQVARICSHLNADPSIVKRHLGANVSWSATVPCVLNAMPWAAGKLGDTYFYDSSALTKFFEEGFLAIVMPIKVDGQVTIQRRHKFALWSAKKPTAQDLLRQLEKPLQLQVLEDEWEIDAPLVLLSKELGLISPFLKRRQPDPRRSLKAYGLGDEDIRKLLDNFEETRNQVLKLKAVQPQPVRKI